MTCRKTSSENGTGHQGRNLKEVGGGGGGGILPCAVFKEVL